MDSLNSLAGLMRGAKDDLGQELGRRFEALEAALSAATDEAAGLQARIAELEARPEPAAPVATDGGIDLEAVRRLDAARSQSELLGGMLPELVKYAARAVVLVARGTQVNAWSGMGFESAALQSFGGDAADSEALGALVRESKVVAFDPSADPVVGTWMRVAGASSEGRLIPVVLQGRTVGGIFIDRLEGRPWDPDGAQAVVALACLMIDTLGLRQSVPTPIVAEPIAIAAPAPTPVAPAAAPAGEVFPGSPPEAAQPPAAAPEEPAVTPPAPEPPPAAPPAPEPAPQPASVAVAPPAPEPAPAPAPAPEPAPVSAQVQPPAEEPKPTPVQPITPPSASTQVVPPPPEPVSSQPAAEGGLPPEVQAKHDEARRFARLLVSEIKLYNEDEVTSGRSSGNIYERLKEDIDRSREMFDKRIAAEVREQRDYFHEELVRILAEGDAAALGM